MLIPLGVLSLGAIFAGMLWYGSFFGDHDKVNSFFGIPHHVEAAAEGHGAEGAGAALTTEAQATEEAADDHGTAAADAGHAVATGEAPQGAIYISADNHVMDEAHHAPTWVKISPFIAMVTGFVVAFYFYIMNPAFPAKLAENQRPLYLFLLNKWYFDEIYDFLFVNPAKAIGRFLWKRGDGNVIDGGINGLAMGVVPYLTRLAGRAQSGYLFHYAFVMLIGMSVLITWLSVGGGAH